MKRLLFSGLLLLTLIAPCAALDQNKSFDKFKKQYIDSLWKMYPEWATNVGYHNYDSWLHIPTESQRKMEIAFHQRILDSLKTFEPNALTDLNQIDLRLIENQCRYGIWYIKDFKAYQWDPREYNIIGTIAFILSENYKPINARLMSIGHKLKNVSAYYRQAKLNISNPTKEHTQLAIEQLENSLPIIEKDLADSLALSKLPVNTKNYIRRNADSAVAAIQDFVSYLKGLKHDNPRSFRIGKELYEKKFQYEIQSQFTVEEIYQAAQQRKEYLQAEMEKLATSLWPKYMGGAKMPGDRLELIRKVIDALSLKHTTPELFQETIEKQIPELTAFVKEKNLVYMDPNKPLKVRKEPAYLAGVAGASISAPGPYDKKGQTYYNVGSMSGWSAEKSESYLREYNDYVLQILNIHEAVPGHYVQLIYNNQSPSIIKSILQNGTMIEGWAVYAELMMLENGYGGNTPEMWLMYYKWNLRSVCNTILDISVHTKNMNRDDALDLLQKEAFQQKTEAENKWRRVQITSVQLTSYFTGFHEIVQLREAYQQKKGGNYTLKSFNEKFLGYGSSPVKYIRQLMLR